MYRKLFATAASFLFVMLLSFSSLGIESQSGFYEGLEKEIVESSGKVALREVQGAISSEANGFEIVLALPALHKQFYSVRSIIIAPPAQHIFLTCCSLLI